MSDIAMHTFACFITFVAVAVFFASGIILNVKKIYYWYKNVTFKETIPEQWRDEPVKYLVRCQWEEKTLPEFIVYIDFEDDLNWCHDNNEKTNLTNENAQIIEQILTEVSFQEIRIKNWNSDIKLQINRLLGEAVVKAFNGDEAGDALKHAEEFIERKQPEVSRAWIVQYSFLTMTCVSLLTLLPAYCLICQPVQPTFSSSGLINALFAFGMGSLGAFYFVLLRLGKVVYDATSEKRLHLFEAGARILVGGVSGIVSLLILKTNIIAPSVFSESNFASILLLAFISGTSERLIPSIISVVENTKK